MVVFPPKPLWKDVIVSYVIFLVSQSLKNRAAYLVAMVSACAYVSTVAWLSPQFFLFQKLQNQNVFQYILRNFDLWVLPSLASYIF